MPIFQSLDLEQMLIYQICFLWKSALFHSINLPFDVQAAEKILHVIYYIRNGLSKTGFPRSIPVFVVGPHFM